MQTIKETDYNLRHNLMKYQYKEKGKMTIV